MARANTAGLDPSGEATEAGPVNSKFRGVLTNLLLLATSFLVAIAVAEGAVRVVSPQQLIMLRPDIWMAVDTLGWRLRPDVDTWVNTGERTVRLITDAEGFRVGRGGRRVQSDSILLIGDSFMEALQVEYYQSLAGLMEDSLVGPNRERVAVRNGAVGAWDPPQYELFGTARLRESTYELMLVSVFVGNDIVRQTVDYFPPREPEERAHFRLPASFSAAEWVDAIARPVNDYLEERAHLFVLLKNRTQALRIKLGLSVAYVPSSILTDRASGPEWEITADLLARFGEFAESHGTPTLFVLIPSRYQVERELFDAHMTVFGLEPWQVDLDQPNRRLYEEMTARGLSVLDALPTFRAAHREGVEVFGAVDPHLSPHGHSVLFDLLRPRLDAVIWH